MFYKMREFVKEIGKYAFDAMQQKHKVNYKEDSQTFAKSAEIHNLSSIIISTALLLKNSCYSQVNRDF